MDFEREKPTEYVYIGLTDAGEIFMGSLTKKALKLFCSCEFFEKIIPFQCIVSGNNKTSRF